MKNILQVILLCTLMVLTQVVTAQTMDLKVCEPYKQDTYGNVHIQYSKSKQENAKIARCMDVLQDQLPRTAIFFEHPLALSNIYGKRLKDQGFHIYNVNEDTQVVTWLWPNQRKIPDRWTTETAVRIVLRNSAGKLLLVKSEGINWLLVPGGGVPKGTLARDAAVDLLRDEIGVEVLPKDLKLIAVLNRTNVYGFKGLNEVTYIYALDQYDEEPQTSTAIEKLYWVTPEKIKKGTMDGVPIHPFAGPLLNQVSKGTARSGYMRISDPSEMNMTMPPMMDVEFVG